jgi:hypothetical protein
MDLAYAFPAYGPNLWGITASDSSKGYVVWGGPPRDPAIDGTIVPSAAGGSFMFTPELSLTALKTMREKFGDRIYGRYGFVDAFNPQSGWIDTEVIGINVGIILLSAENGRTGDVWRWFMRNQEIPRAMDRIGFVVVKATEINRPLELDAVAVPQKLFISFSPTFRLEFSGIWNLEPYQWFF